MKLHLIRHGNAENESQSGHDFDRSLSTKGVNQTLNLGIYLNLKINDCEVWCSGAVRTRETLKSISKSYSNLQPIYFRDLYLCSKQDLLHHIWKRQSNEDLLIVGHNFGISDLLSYFVDDLIEMETADYYCIDFGGLTSEETFQGTGVITDQYHPQV
ncbi:MAG: phosphoglycerate mutase family protein [Crocinitomicaceae bacterium]|nr:phosphoglycerate mutase family protein [Crocinitomicaceae bacterium]MDG1775908.1 phosphoglycerate mutase family protein [Crocinitomicaceae bacterium]